MNNNFVGSLVVVLTGIIGVATLAVIFSKNANTAGVTTAGGNALNQLLSTAVSPITGSGSSSINLNSGLSGLSSYMG